jgi:hypothetical protein
VLPREPLRVVVSGMVAGVPGQGGAAWAVLNWVLGFRSLGHDVLLVEEVERITPARRAALGTVAVQAGLRGRAALVAPGCASAGLPYEEVAARCRRADVLVNLAGSLRDPELREPPPRRAYVDLDPAFTQVWHDQGIDVGLGGHTGYFTVGLNVGGPDWRLPTGGIEWRPILPPVALDRWTPGEATVHDAWTTVGHWRGYGSAEYDGIVLGQRAHSWRELLTLPRLTSEPLLPALAIHPGEEKDVAALEEHGWSWIEPGTVAADPAAYLDFVRGSKGELGIAKEGYVASKSAWFSDRSACYLAAGRPVVAQDTGWSDVLPTGAGLFAFTTAEEAAERLVQVARDYTRHALAARRLAEERLRSELVLGSLLEEVR